MEFCLQPMGFMKFLQSNNYQAENKKKTNRKSKNTVKNRWDCVEIVSLRVCVCVSVCMRAYVRMCVCVGYSCVCVCVSGI